MILGIIVVVGALVFLGFILYILISDNKATKKENNNLSKNNSRKKSKKKDTSTKVKNTNNKGILNKLSEEEILDSSEILEFDCIENIITSTRSVGLVRRGNTYLGYINIKGINYNLLSLDERIRLEKNYQDMLNGLDFPIQIYIQSRKVNSTNYINRYVERLKVLKEKIDDLSRKLEQVEGHESEQEYQMLAKEVNRYVRQYEYGINIVNYTEERCMSKDMLQRKYYIILGHELTGEESKLDRNTMLGQAFNNINNKAESIISVLRRSDLKGELVSAIECADLLYSSYNKSESELIDLKKVVKSKFNSLITTSTPVEEKIIDRQIELKEKEIEDIKVSINEINSEDRYYDLEGDI